MKLRLLGLAFFLAIGHAFAQSPASPAKLAVAVELVNSLNLQQHMQTMIDNLAPAGIRREITQRIVMQRVDMRSFELLVARVYADNFTEDELKGLVAFYRSELGRKMQSRQPAMTKEVSAAILGSQDLMTNFVVSGCAAGVVSSAADQAQKFQISVGKPPPTLDDMMRNIGPLVAKAEVSCVCMYKRAMAVSVTKDPGKMFQEPAVKQAVDEALRSGACPAPS